MRPLRDGRRPRRRSLVAGLAAVALVAGVPAAPTAAQTECDPTGTEPEYLGDVPTSQDVIGYRIGRREATTDELYAYLDAIDAASDRVATGVYGESVYGRPLRYAVVGDPENIAPEALEATRQAILRIRDPGTPQDEIDALAATTPAFLYIAGNVHGTEESGADASLRTLYDLADRVDCAALRILDKAIVFVIPTQNPDGRDLDTRRNAYGFDMNRDWAARTQPEIDALVELLRVYPPQLFVDAHEFGFYRSFFPPNDDPIHHEVSSQVLGWVNGVFGPALAEEYERNDWGFFNYAGYDFFAPIYGDTVPSDGFQAVGITLEVYDGAPMSLRVKKRRVEFWRLLSEGAIYGEELLRSQHEAYVEAVAQGRRGELEPNAVYRPGSVLIEDVPRYRVRHYFLRASPGRRFELRTLVRRLQRMDVEVYRLDDPVRLEDYRPYGPLERSAATLPAGTYWIPMAQPQKHWIQLMLAEDAFTPVRRTYDVTGWSSPLLFGLEGGSTGERLSPDASLVQPVAEPEWPIDEADLPRIAVLSLSNAVYAYEGVGHLRWVFDTMWEVPYEVIRPEDVAGGALDGFDVVVVPSGGALVGERKLGEEGVDALRVWIDAGGRYVGYKFGGALLAERLGLTSAGMRNPDFTVEGPLIRVRIDPSSPLGDGVGRWVWVVYDDDDLVDVRPSAAPLRYPELGEGFQVSGVALHTQDLAGRVAAVDEPFGDGRVVLFPFDVNFRGYTLGTLRVLWNAIVGPDPG